MNPILLDVDRPADAPSPGDDATHGLGTEGLSDDRLFCAHCDHPVTREAWRISLRGDHDHVVFNPAGVVFRIGCFEQAEGCLPMGPPSCQFSWFSGYVWRMALCSDCGWHLGWHYAGDGAPATFFGLIQDRIRTRPPENSPTQ
ncbi:cereblon family protein [Magnetospira sp. QH-2]|uniref:cereblon family protein n=1 Tax=Magnetospira sp. (strain QH-2) TaxID=1288970 RepID=UPI0003E81072|nr:cereblon family protein [Magnetospira sp. QH-2]CCQ73239.1 Conserved protein of unknown function. Similar to Cereblon isoform 4 from Magnetospirillum gryphiswaldense [Magnetospira sp. QH-2]